MAGIYSKHGLAEPFKPLNSKCQISQITMTCFTLQENTTGSRYLCASVTLDVNGDHLTKGVAHAVYDKCRAGSLEMPGFPNFDGLLNALRAGATSVAPAEYQVCAPVACPQSVILSDVWG